MDTKIDVTIENVRQYTKEHVKPSRFEHCERVAQMCAFLCKKFGLDEKKGYLVGIGHDMCKDLPAEKMLEVAARDGNPILDYEKTKPSLLHGRAAAVLMKEDFKIEDKDILEAVANHICGFCEMGNLTKCLFLADKIEPGRPQSTDEYRNNLLSMDLDSMTGTVIIENYKYVSGKGYEVYPETKKMVDYYQALLEKK
ncbi:MAG: bis(5'-nucleosyl)-tetraphosphatase (symmetrical) YqeK [Treponema sp.]|nr:bis(5'-nucleosyl)-tetraphosphatase (symmetrical) YqeK [Treponema sp.]